MKEISPHRSLSYKAVGCGKEGEPNCRPCCPSSPSPSLSSSAPPPSSPPKPSPSSTCSAACAAPAVHHPPTKIHLPRPAILIPSNPLPSLGTSRFAISPSPLNFRRWFDRLYSSFQFSSSASSFFLFTRFFFFFLRIRVMNEAFTVGTKWMIVV